MNEITGIDLVVNGRFANQPLTGVQRYGYELVRRLPVSTVVTPEAPLPEYPALRCRRLKIQRTAARGHLWEQLALPKAVPDGALLWSPGGSGPLRVRDQVLTIHDVAHLEHPEWYGRRFALWYRVLLPLLARRVRRVLTVSEFSKDRIVRRLGLSPDKIDAIPLGVDPRFRIKPAGDVEATLRRLGVAKPYLLAVSAVSPRKNLPRLVAAWQRVQPSIDDVRLVMVGKTGLAFSGQKAGVGMASRTQTFEQVTDEDLVDLYNGALGFVYPSLYEGFGLPVLEAMACGTPVVTSDVTSLPEVAGDAALLIDPHTSDAIARGILLLCADAGLRANLRAMGLQRTARFTWDATAARTWQSLEDVAAGAAAERRSRAPRRATASVPGVQR